MSSEYYVTNLDLWIISKIYDIPIILISGKTLLENKDIMLVLNESKTDEYYFIKSPGIKTISSTQEDNDYPQYYIISEFNENLQIKMKSLSDNLQSKIQSELKAYEKNNYIEYINKFSYSKKEGIEKIKEEKKIKKLKKQLNIVTLDKSLKIKEKKDEKIELK